MKPDRHYEFTTYKGKDIFILDLSDTKPEESMPVLEDVQPRIAASPKNSILALTDVTNAVFDSAASKQLKEFAAMNSPYVRASAVVGADGFRAVLLGAVRLVAKREIKAFKTRQAAMDWLVSLD